jgi:hypothetical protein
MPLGTRSVTACDIPQILYAVGSGAPASRRLYNATVISIGTDILPQDYTCEA